MFTNLSVILSITKDLHLTNIDPSSKPQDDTDFEISSQKAYNMAMNESSSKIRRFAPTRHIAQSDSVSEVSDEHARTNNKPLSLSEQPDSKSIAAKQTYRLQEQINAQRGGMPRYGEITGNDIVAKTARLQEEINKRRQSGN